MAWELNAKEDGCLEQAFIMVTTSFGHVVYVKYTWYGEQTSKYISHPQIDMFHSLVR